MAAISVAAAIAAALELASALLENCWKKSRARAPAICHFYAREMCKLRRLIAASNNKVVQFRNKSHQFFFHFYILCEKNLKNQAGDELQRCHFGYAINKPFWIRNYFSAHTS